MRSEFDRNGFFLLLLLYFKDNGYNDNPRKTF